LKRILVVDDERQITRMLRASLQSCGYEVLVAGNGVEAYSLFETERPDLIITDLAMPEMNGLELTQAVRRLAQTPIIVLSVRDTDAMKVTALDEGADDYLTKPFSMPELLARVRAQLRRNAEADAAETHLEVGDFVIDGSRTGNSPDAEGVRSGGVVCACSESRADAQGVAEGDLGAGGGSSTGVSEGADCSVEEEDRARRWASIHRERALGGVSIRAGRY
jgi:CheY-like chemotaxis protein